MIRFAGCSHCLLSGAVFAAKSSAGAAFSNVRLSVDWLLYDRQRRWCSTKCVARFRYQWFEIRRRRLSKALILKKV